MLLMMFFRCPRQMTTSADSRPFLEKYAKWCCQKSLEDLLGKGFALPSSSVASVVPFLRTSAFVIFQSKLSRSCATVHASVGSPVLNKWHYPSQTVFSIFLNSKATQASSLRDSSNFKSFNEVKWPRNEGNLGDPCIIHQSIFVCRTCHIFLTCFSMPSNDFTNLIV